jgi:hypothetical protein
MRHALKLWPFVVAVVSIASLVYIAVNTAP